MGIAVSAIPFGNVLNQLENFYKAALTKLEIDSKRLQSLREELNPSDEELAEQIQNKDYGKLLANPKIQSIMQDKQLLEKMFALNKKIMEESLDEVPSNISTENQPKVIDIK